MVSYGEVRQWRPGPLDSAERSLKALSDKLLDQSDEFVVRGTPAGWTGDAAAAAARQRTTIGDRMDGILAGVRTARGGLASAADAVTSLSHAVQETDNLAQVNGFGIGDNGAVRDVAPPRQVPAELVDEVRRQRQRMADELVDRVERILLRANDIDGELGSLLSKIATGEAETAQARVSVAEPPDGTPAENASWWNSLSEDEQQRIIENHPDWIGNRDGIPATDRDQANRSILADEKVRLEAEEAALRADLDDNFFGGIFTDDDSELEAVQGKLKGIEAIESKLDSTAGLGQSERHYLLGFDTGEDGKAIVAKGNPDSADNVATFVPGTGADLEGVGGLLNRGDKMWLAADDSSADESTSVVTWLGYDAPDNIPLAASQEYATGARQDLDSFHDGLRVTHEGGPSHNTVIGHSYGSTVIGHAGRDLDLDVDKMVFVGSPGVGVDHASELNIDPGDVYATTAREDIIRLTPEFIHGNHPVDDDFGAHEFEADPGEGGISGGVHTHSAYWDDGNKALTNLGHIIVGNTDRLSSSAH
ncbi:alpha/beta hydrolase [Amycolatopsis sp. 195334CR]|uniref:alpha/beta hydrolase n=1 Tax=Amycolatopsis sp. 195334CR TaxID=2814588 RepID=UPI001A8FC217|nr:alpha/beta hydrolase [Amycolatopsis sp. 195334CR]MBN6036650.1 alpha/beta hydrolase [Amycolatopsis sp. 195334CR]